MSRKPIQQGANTAAKIIIVSGPSPQAKQLAASMAYAVNTASPMSTGGGHARVWRGDPGYGVNRWVRRLDLRDPGPNGGPGVGAIRPIAIPVADSVRLGAQGGPSSPAAYPSTGVSSNFGAVAGLDLGKLRNLGLGA